MEKSNSISLVFLSVLMAFSHLNCASQMTLQKCIEQEVRTVLKSSNESYLSKNEDLVMLVNSYKKSKVPQLKFALIHKDDYASFMRDKQKKHPKGYLLIDGLTTLIYGDLQMVELIKIRSEMQFMKDNKQVTRKDGMPPLPPSTVEPEIFRYEKNESCFRLVEKSMSMNLF